MYVRRCGTESPARSVFLPCLWERERLGEKSGTRMERVPTARKARFQSPCRATVLFFVSVDVFRAVAALRNACNAFQAASLSAAFLLLPVPLPNSTPSWKTAH